MGSALVNVSDNTTLLIRVVNLSNEPQRIAANTVVAVAKPVEDVTTIDTPERDHDNTPAADAAEAPSEPPE